MDEDGDLSSSSLPSSRNEDQSEDTNYPRYCVPRWCRLCRFSIVAGDTIVAIIDDSRESSPFVYSQLIHHDTKLQANFVYCHPTCYHGFQLQGPAVGYHAECLTFAASMPSAEFLHATGYRFEPMPWQDRRRHRLTKQLLAERLRRVCPQLPAELWLMVAQHLVRQCAIITTEALWAARQSSHCCVDTSKSVWARHVSIDGVRYLDVLSNEPGPGYSRVLDIDTVPRVDSLYISEDHLGVRQLVFAALGDRFKVPSFEKAKQGHWWRTLAPCPTKLEGKSDGLKLRGIGPWMPGVNKFNVTWSLPLQPFESDSLSFASLAPLRPNMPPLPHLQMLPFHINASQATGYSVAWSYRFLTLHTHYNGEDMSFYQDLDAIDANLLWIYMPNGPGELITELWFRQALQYQDSGLVFKTNRNRITIAGPLLKNLAERTWFKLCGPLEGPTKLFFNHNPWGIQHLAVEKHVLLPSSVPREPPLPLFGSDSCFYTSADLSGVVEITPCQWQQPKQSEDDPLPSFPRGWAGRGSPRIIGLLLRYSNGSQACVGQFRLDGAGEPMSVDNAPGLYLKFNGHGHVAKVQLSPPPESEGSHRWLAMDWTGEIEWLFDKRSCQVFHEDRASDYYASEEKGVGDLSGRKTPDTHREQVQCSRMV